MALSKRAATKEHHFFYYALLQAAKLHAGIIEKSRANYLYENVWKEAGFEAYCSSCSAVH